MNKILEMVLAKQVIEVALKNTKDNTYVIYDIERNKIVQKEAVSGLDIIKQCMNYGLSPTSIIEYKEKVGFLIEHLLENDCDQQIADYFIFLLSKSDVEKLNQSVVNNIYYESDYNINFLDKLFSFGFDFEQGKFDEIDKALNGDLSFFELCLAHKPDFKFNFKYDDGLFLDEHLKEDLEYCKAQGIQDSKLQKKESLLVFLQKAREMQELKEKLENKLNQNQNSTPNLNRKI